MEFQEDNVRAFENEDQQQKEQNQQDDEKDSLETLKKSASRWSKVSKKSIKSHRTHFYWLIGGTMAILLVLMLSSHQATPLEKETQNNLSEDYQSSLNANLARLKALSEEKQTSKEAAVIPSSLSSGTFPSDNTLQPIPNSAESKAYLARQNAPTSMYAGEAGSMTTNNTNDRNTPTGLFADQGVNSRFANTNAVTTTIEAQSIPHPDFTIASGEFLQAVLETAINSDLPGMVRAVVSKPVYSYTGERVIIPAGSRLIGQYSSAVIQGQNRVMIIWNRAILPNGIAVQLNSPGTDELGRAGQGADSVNSHFLARFSEAVLLSVIGAGVANSGVSDQDQYNSAAQYRIAIAQSFQQSAQHSLEDTLPMKPTLHIYQGANLNVFVAHDLSFYQVLKHATDLPTPPFFVK